MNRLEVDQVMGPVRNHALFFCGFHVAKNNPEFQVTTMHYCGMRGEGDYEMHQCLLYDSIGAGAKLLGVEYIVPDKAFRSLPDEEKKYWHPHSYEVLGGGLVAPVMSDQAEIDFMTYLLTTWGKSWHTWPDPTTALPLGEPSASFLGTSKDEVGKMLTEHFLPADNVVLEQNALVLNTGDKLVLIDTGMGSSTMFGPSTGKLLSSLAPKS